MKCNVCGRKLTSRASTTRGIGPVCLRKVQSGRAGVQIKMFNAIVENAERKLIVGRHCEDCEEMTLHEVFDAYVGGGYRLRCTKCEGTKTGHGWVYL